MKYFIQIIISLLFFLSSFTVGQGKIKKEKISYGNDYSEKSIGLQHYSAPHLSYSIEPYYETNGFRLIVVMEFKGEKSGETKLILPENSLSNYENKAIKVLKPLSSDTYFIDTDKPEIKIVKYNPGTLVKIYYQIEQISYSEPEVGTAYTALLNKKYIHFLGETFFITPDWDSSEEYNIQIFWNKMPQNWNLANSFGINQKFQTVKIPLWKFKNALFVGGDFRILRRMVYNNPVYVAIKGKWSFTDAQFCDLVQQIRREQTDFWSDSNNPFLLITLLPILGSDNQIGIVRYNSYSICLSKERQIDFKLKMLVANKSFRYWLGGKIKARGPEVLLYWFIEGFSEFYARLILLRSNQITFDEYLEDYNEVLEEYAKSPYQNVKNEVMEENYWTDNDFNRLPILRGDIIAHNLNSAIISNTDQAKCLDDLMLEIFKRSKSESFFVSSGSLYNLIRFYAGEQTLSDITKSLNSGVPLKIYSNALGPCFTIQTEYSRKYWLFGPLYEINSYVTKDDNEILDKDCFSTLGLK